MFCINWEDDDIDIYGEVNEESFHTLEIILVPCNYIHPYLGY